MVTVPSGDELVESKASAACGEFLMLWIVVDVMHLSLLTSFRLAYFACSTLVYPERLSCEMVIRSPRALLWTVVICAERF